MKESAEYVLGRYLWMPTESRQRIPSLPFRILREAEAEVGKIAERGFDTSDPQPIIRYKPSNSILFFPTNGVGFGHFARCYSILKELWEHPDVELVFLTTMPTLHYLSDIGALAYHLPRRYRYADMTPAEWNSMFSDLFIGL